jgi:hypothetical protein
LVGDVVSNPFWARALGSKGDIILEIKEKRRGVYIEFMTGF